MPYITYLPYELTLLERNLNTSFILYFNLLLVVDNV